MAVGSTLNNAGTRGIATAISWNGRRWRVRDAVSPGPTAALSGVSCTAGLRCTAVVFAGGGFGVLASDRRVGRGVVARVAAWFWFLADGALAGSRLAAWLPLALASGHLLVGGEVFGGHEERGSGPVPEGD
jgi:hypothetical protein